MQQAQPNPRLIGSFPDLTLQHIEAASDSSPVCQVAARIDQDAEKSPALRRALVIDCEECRAIRTWLLMARLAF